MASVSPEQCPWFLSFQCCPQWAIIAFSELKQKGLWGDKPEPSSWPGSWLLSNVWFIAGRSLPSPAAGAQRRPLPQLCALCCGCPHVPLRSLSLQGTVPIGSHPASFILSMFHQVLETVTHRRSQPKLMTPDFFWSKFHKWFWWVEPLLTRTLKHSKVMERDDHSGVTKKPGHRVIEPHSSLDTRLEVYTQLLSPENWPLSSGWVCCERSKPCFWSRGSNANTSSVAPGTNMDVRLNFIIEFRSPLSMPTVG